MARVFCCPQESAEKSLEYVCSQRLLANGAVKLRPGFGVATFGRRSRLFNRSLGSAPWAASTENSLSASTHTELLDANALGAAFQRRLASEPLFQFDEPLARQSDRAAAALRALAEVMRTTLAQRYSLTQSADREALTRGEARRVHYLSMEFLLGRALGNAIAALGAREALQTVLDQCGLQLSDLLESEPDAALGNGGLGRLAACFLDAFAQAQLPSFGYGLRYQFGMFAQQIHQGKQVEVPDDWLRYGHAWEIPRPELRYEIGFGGQIQTLTTEQPVNLRQRRRWQADESLLAQAFDFIVPSHQSSAVSTLRLWHASSAQSIDFAAFCRGDYLAANAERIHADALNWVLYPDDSTPAGRRLRLKQEFFLVSASLQDLIARHLNEGQSLATLAQRNAIHLNDTHPALAPVELLRLLIDEYALAWEQAWAITHAACSYTNHTLMPEALEVWPVALMAELLPRHLELIYELNAQFLQEVRARFPNDEALVQRVSLIDENHGRRVRMALLAIVCASKVNGVAALHSRLMQETIFADFYRIYPRRFINITNGVTPRRWLQQANPRLSALIDQRLGNSHWRRDLSGIGALRNHADDLVFAQQFMAVKAQAKSTLAARIQRDLGIVVNPQSLFAVHIKRIHEYKRQLLNLLHVIARYQAILANPSHLWQPRTVILAGKAASAYQNAKLIIQLAHDVMRVVNADPAIGDALKVVFLPNYSVSLAELIIPAADLSEQISTAGTEASGTGNMKFAMNGACTIGTWDGANIEMAEAMGPEYFFEFGLRAPAIEALKQQGYVPRRYVEQCPSLQRVLNALGAGEFSPEQPDRYRALLEGLLTVDPYFLMADFASYQSMQLQIDAEFADQPAWARRAIHNTAGMGRFSADRTVQEYMDLIWSPSALAAGDGC